jgi:FkbM family methyltransferase
MNNCINRKKIVHLIINKPAFYFSESIYAFYIQAVGKLFNKSFRIKKKNLILNGLKSQVYIVINESEKTYITSGHRSSRFIKGFNNASERSWRRYGIPELIKSHEVKNVIDVGANIGEFSYAAKIHGAREVFAFEPDPIAFNCLQNNLTRFQEIHLFQTAMSNKNNFQKFYLSSKSADSSLLKPPNIESIIEVETKLLDNYLKIFPKHIDLLKIEAEGFEPEIIFGAIRLLKQVKYISIDAGPERFGQTTVEEVCKILKEQNFKLKIFNETIVHGVRR